MRRVSTALLGGLFAMYASTVLAVDFADGLYLGVNAGIAEERDFCDNFTIAPGFEEPPGCDDSDFTWQLFLGYQLAKWFSVEGGYTDLGGSEIREVQTSVTTDTRGWTLNGVFTVPLLERAGLYGTLGAYFWDREVKSATAITLAGSQQSATGTDYYWGLGLRYPFTDNVGINVDVKSFKDVGNSEVGQGDHFAYTIGLLFRL